MSATLEFEPLIPSRWIAGHYVTQDVDSEYLELLERSTRSKTRALAEATKQKSTESLTAAR